MLCVLTATGARPEAFAKCVEYMQAQDYPGPVRWIVVDDGPEPMPTPHVEGWQIVHIRPHPLWEPGQNTQARNMLEGLQFVGVDDKLVIAEDDDGYPPDWLSRCNKWLDHDDLAGECPSIYRHLNGTEKQLHNKNHASLCQTAMKGPGIDAFRKACETNEKFIDITLWRSMPGKLYQWDDGVVGIKGWPGRPGIGIGHKM